MTIKNKSLIGASLASYSDTWNDLPWRGMYKQVIRLQVRIAKATKEGRLGKVKALQRILTCSFYAKCIAVKRVTQNKGAKTAGIDRVIWRGSFQKMRAVSLLKRRGYKPLPLKRVYIPKKQKGKLRPLSIPCMGDRAMQALWHLALEPIAEGYADLNSYGFRPRRAARDAIEQCFNVFAQKNSAKWILEGDILQCFDKICHDWLLNNIPMDRLMLRKFLKAGYMDKKLLHPAELGVPQGGVIAPTIALMALSGLEKKIKTIFKKKPEKVNVVVYADDFIISGATRELLEEQVIPVVKEFLGERGLEISDEKSKITHIDEGFNFLGFNIRKYNKKLIIKPTRDSIKSFLDSIRSVIKTNKTARTENLICLLNPKITGWANYYRHVVSSRAYAYVDHYIYKALASWMNRRHPNKGKRWVAKKYFRRRQSNNWCFYANVKNKDGITEPLYLKHAKSTSIRRYIKVRAVAQPYDPAFKEYFRSRKHMNR